MSFSSGNMNQGPTGRQQKNDRKDLNVFGFHVHHMWAIVVGALIIAFVILNYYLHLLGDPSSGGMAKNFDDMGLIPALLGVVFLLFGWGRLGRLSRRN